MDSKLNFCWFTSTIRLIMTPWTQVWKERTFIEHSKISSPRASQHKKTIEVIQLRGVILCLNVKKALRKLIIMIYIIRIIRRPKWYIMLDNSIDTKQEKLILTLSTISKRFIVCKLLNQYDYDQKLFDQELFQVAES